jgi:hypothetical protein
MAREKRRMKKTHRKTLETQDFDTLEAHLAGTLRPVQPPPVVVHRLRGRIHFPQRERLVKRLNEWRSLFMALGGVLSGMMVIITVARALYHLVGRRG